MAEHDEIETPTEPVDEPAPSVAVVPVPSVQKLGDESTRGGSHVGTILEKARRRLHYSPETISLELGIRTLELAAIESGMTTPSPEVAKRLAEFYGLDPERLDPSRRAERVSGPDDGDLLYLGTTAVNLAATDGSNAEVLWRIATTMRSIRDVHENAPLTIRNDELDVISSVLDMEDPNIAADLMATFGLTTAEAAQLAARLRQASLSRKELPAAE